MKFHEAFCKMVLSEYDPLYSYITRQSVDYIVRLKSQDIEYVRTNGTLVPCSFKREAGKYIRNEEGKFTTEVPYEFPREDLEADDWLF